MKKTRVIPPDVAQSPGLSRWKALRSGADAPEDGYIVVEAPLEVEVSGFLVATLMCTPELERELAVGYCLGEGILPDASAIGRVDVVAGEDAPERVRIEPKPDVEIDRERLREPRFVHSGCVSNAPGSWGCTLPPVGAGIRVVGEVLTGAIKSLAIAQEAYKAAGGIHAAGLFSADGSTTVVCEDIGRHNAVDKALGFCALQGIPVADKFVLGTGRASYELVTKTARLGVSLVASLSSPTSLSVQLADVLNQTLVGYLRARHFIIYTHPWRIEGHAL